MGNSNEKTKTKPFGDGHSFSGDEVTNVEAIFNEMTGPGADAKHSKTLTKEPVKKVFQENPEFAAKLFIWLSEVSENKQVTFNNFISAIEVLTQEPVQYQLKHYQSRTFDKLEVFLQISTEQYLKDRDGLMQSSISKAQCMQFLKEILNAFHSQSAPNEKNIENTARLIATGFYKEGEESISWRDFLYSVKQSLPYINKMIKLYFMGKLVERSIPLHVPALDGESYILNKEMLGLFYLSNTFFQNVIKLHLIYSTAKSGTSFNRLAYAIKGYEAPTLILIKHIEQADETRGKERSSYVFGGFSRAAWSDELKYHGDSESYIFSLMPTFKAFYAYRGQGGTNYQYLNTKRIQNSKYKVGMGFGGADYKNYRLWLDEELEAGSYVNPDDNTYDKGYLVDPSITKFNVAYFNFILINCDKIEHVEVWGLGDETTLQGQLEYRQREMEIIESQRKVDKKAFLQSGFDKEMFLGNTFKTAERADGTDFRAEMEKEQQQKQKF